MKKYIFFFLLIFSSTAFSKNLLVDVDITQYKASDSKTLLDFSYSFADTTLRFEYDSAGVYSGEIYFDVQLYSNTNDSLRQRWIMPVSLKNYDGSHKQVFFGTKKIYAKPGQYVIDVQVKDWRDTSTNAHSSFDYHVRNFEKEDLMISDLQIAFEITKKEDSNLQWAEMYEKNGYFVVPNPSCEYSDLTSTLLLYSEIYNAKQYQANGVKVVYDILSSSNKIVATFDKTINAPANAIVNVEVIPLDTLPTGAYYLDMYLQYPAENPTLETKHAKQKFFYSNSQIGPDEKLYFIENLSFEKSEFAVMSKERVEDEIAKSMRIANEADIQLYNAIKDSTSSLKAKQRFLFRFWSVRDEDSTTAMNETLAKYREMIKFADFMYSFGQIKGWKTDRGYVVMKYGKPSRINHYNQFTDDHPYEIWEYDGYYGGCTFTFVNTNGLQQLKLVHSTAPGEIYNSEWKTLFLRGSSFDERNENNNSNGQSIGL